MIIIPDLIWLHMLAEFRRVRSGVERVAYLDGVPIERGGVVTTLTIPNAILEPRRYQISAAAMSEAGKHLRAHGLVRLAQVHTHGGDWVGHSSADDQRAYSQIASAISIVLPYHARRRPTLAESGVHIREVDGWRHIDRRDVSQYVCLVPGLLDFRRA